MVKGNRKSILLAIGVLFMHLFFGELFAVDPTDQSPNLSLDKQEKYHGGATEERFTFYARENDRSSRMIERRGIIIRRPGAKVTVFVFHGFMCNKHDIRFLGPLLFGHHKYFQEPLNVVIIDFRAHGEACTNQCCSFGQNEKYDVIGAVDFIRKHTELKDTVRVAYGFSMGAVASILAQAQDPSLFHMAIWDCPFESSENILGRGLERLKINLFGYEFPLPCRSVLKKYAYNSYVQGFVKFMLKTLAKMDSTQINTHIVPIDTVAAAQKITIPTLCITCKKDDKAPVCAVRQVHDALNGNKCFWATNGDYHFGSLFYYPEKYAYKIRSFIEKGIKGELRDPAFNKIVEDPVQTTDHPTELPL